jgi:hypothetical protein
LSILLFPVERPAPVTVMPWHPPWLSPESRSGEWRYSDASSGSRGFRLGLMTSTAGGGASE